MEQKRERTHRYGQQCGDCRREGVEVEVEEGIRGINGKGKKYNKNILLK